jgi:O-antigen/teichoic acid export membrane protein
MLSSPHITRPGLIALAKKGGVAVLDQALFASANFSVNILLARWLEPTQYGAFVVAYSVFLLVSILHTSLLTEPMSVFGAGKYAATFREYLGILIYMHWGITGAIALMLALGAGVSYWFGAHDMAKTVAALAVASPFILLVWLIRRGFYLLFRYHWALSGSALYLILIIGSTLGLLHLGWLSAGSALMAMGLAGLISSVWLLLILRPQFRRVKCHRGLTSILADHWKYGHWSILAHGIYWSSGSILTAVLVPVFLGLQEGAIIAAALNLFRPIHPLMQSFTSIMLPTVSTFINQERPSKLLMRYVNHLVIACPAGVFLYGIIITVFSESIICYIYEGKYNLHRAMIFLLTLIYTTSSSIQVLSIFFKSSGNVKFIVNIWIVSAAIVSVLSIPMIMLKGITGSLVVILLSYVIAFIYAYKRLKMIVESL